MPTPTRITPEVNSHKFELIGSMADKNESQISDVPNLTEASAEVQKQFRRTEAEMVRLAAAAQGAIPRGMVGDPRGAVGGAVGGAEETHQQIHGENMKQTSRQTNGGTRTTDEMPK
jgi:hypothetical protein